jgi:hypothetical protein
MRRIEVLEEMQDQSVQPVQGQRGSDGATRQPPIPQQAPLKLPPL